jgi:hypothetical protein
VPQAFKLANLLAQGRLRNSQTLCRPRDAQFLGYGNKVSEQT